ncbi:MAG: hypothetical protein HXY30_15200 [Pseudorhodoplanes sp.]|nr:hypothetical protein [Pseudorhodoplanes sp.]
MRLRSGRKPSTILAASAALAGLSLAVGACSSIGSTGSADSGSSRSFSDLFSSGGAGSSFAQTSAPANPGEPKFDPEDCPAIDIRQGASSLSINSASRDPAAAGLRYQVNVAQTARECRLEAGNLAIKVGMQARIIVGQAGGPGQIEIPIRYALVQEGVSPKTIWTKLYKVPAVIGEGQPHATVTHIEENMTVPMPPRNALDAYVIYVGFDPLGAQPETGKKKPPARKRTDPTG